MTTNYVLDFLIKIMPIVTPILSVAWMIHSMDKRISLLEANHGALDNKLEKIYLMLFKRSEQ